MKGLFIPGITAEMFRNGCLESIEALMAEGKIYDIEYSRWIPVSERMPETTDYYLVTVGINEYGLMIPSVRTALYNAKTKDFTVHTGTNMCIVGDVIAWCDCLPEPYKSKIPTGAEGSEE